MKLLRTQRELQVMMILEILQRLRKVEGALVVKMVMMMIVVMMMKVMIMMIVTKNQ